MANNKQLVILKKRKNTVDADFKEKDEKVASK